MRRGNRMGSAIIRMDKVTKTAGINATNITARSGKTSINMTTRILRANANTGGKIKTDNTPQNPFPKKPEILFSHTTTPPSKYSSVGT